MKKAIFNIKLLKDGININNTGLEEKISREKKADPKKHGSKSRLFKIIGISVGCVAAAVLICLTIAGVMANGRDTIFPKVEISGVNVGGMTTDQAEKELLSAGFDAAEMPVVSVVLSDQVTLGISNVDAGFEVSAGSAAQMAYDYGRDGGFFANGWKLIKSSISTVKLEAVGGTEINEENIRSMIATAAAEANTKAIENAYSVKGDNIEIVKGVSGIAVDEDKVYDLIKTAFDEKDYGTIKYSSDSEKLGSFDFDALYDKIYVAPENAVYDSDTGSATDGVIGISFDKDAAKKAYSSAKEGETISIPIIKTDPEITKDALDQVLFRDVLSERSTTLYSSSDNRVNNVTLAASAINGTVLNPGDTFSFNGTVGERTADKGYMTAGAYVGGKTVQEYGGGICQVSSTIYCCVLYADLEVVERSEHMYAVSYLPLGLDATVNWGSLDFQFKNSSQYPVKIISYVQDRVLYVQLVGTNIDGSYNEIESVLVSTIPYDTVEQVDNTLSPGDRVVDTSGYTGYVADTYIYRYDANGNLLNSEFITRSVYDKRDEIDLVGPAATASPAASATPAA